MLFVHMVQEWGKFIVLFCCLGSGSFVVRQPGTDAVVKENILKKEVFRV